MRTTNYQAQEQEWFSADAWESAGGKDWEDMDAWEGADAWEGESADGGGIRPMRTSKPYIIQIVNACTSSIANVDVGDSNLQRSASNFGQNSNITITSTVTGTSYIEFLAETENQPFKVGKILIISATAAQFDETIAITHRDANGNRQDSVIILTIDPYQQQTDRIIHDEEFLFDGYTRLRFSNIRASATVTLRLYPTDKFAATQVLAGRGAQQMYNAPRIVKVIPTAAPRQPRRLR